MHHEIDGFGEPKRPVRDKLLIKAKQCLYLAFCYHAIGIRSKSPSVPTHAIQSISDSVYMRFLESHEELLGHQIVSIENSFDAAIRAWLSPYPDTIPVVPLAGIGKALFPDSFR